MANPSASSAPPELAALEAQFALSRAALADKIFARYGQSSSSSVPSSPNSSSKGSSGRANGLQSRSNSSKSPFVHRPPTLGLGAKQDPDKDPLAVRPDGSHRLGVEDARLKGRLSKKGGDREAATLSSGKKRQVDESEDDEDEEDSKVALAAQRSKKAAAKQDPFAAKIKAKPAKKAEETPVKAPPSKPESNEAKVSPAQKDSTSEETNEPTQKLSKNQRKKLNKRRRLEEAGGAGNAASQGEDEPMAEASSQQTKPDELPQAASSESSPAPEGVAATASAFKPSATLPAVESTSAGALSAHQKALHAKLLGSHFRQLNESLYTSQSADSFRLAQEDPSRMQAYHDGFREQVKKWPQKPYALIGDIIAADIVAGWEKILKANGQPTGKGKDKEGHSAGIPPGAVVADLGAGEGPLAQYLGTHPKFTTGSKAGHAPLPHYLRPRVMAYDLLDTADGIVRGVDCASSGGVPLPGRLGGGIRERLFRLGSAQGAAENGKAKGKGKSSGADEADAEFDPSIADVAVFCLSLMGTDWVSMLLEARRVLKPGGQLLVAEVSSRLSSTEDFIALVQKLGFKFKPAKQEDSNTHFALFRFSKLKAGELKAEAESRGIALDVAGVDEARSLDQEEESRLKKQGQDILKPCLYKRR